MSFIKENFVAFLTRLSLGFFLSLALGGIFYVVAWIIVISFWAITPNTILVMATSGIGVGAIVGEPLEANTTMTKHQIKARVGSFWM